MTTTRVCPCADCVTVASMARETCEPVNLTLPLLLGAYCPCPHALATYRQTLAGRLAPPGVVVPRCWCRAAYTCRDCGQTQAGHKEESEEESEEKQSKSNAENRPLPPATIVRKRPRDEAMELRPVKRPRVEPSAPEEDEPSTPPFAAPLSPGAAPHTEPKETSDELAKPKTEETTVAVVKKRLLGPPPPPVAPDKLTIADALMLPARATRAAMVIRLAPYVDSNTRNRHVRDGRIVFDEGPHRYIVDGSSEGYISVTGLVHKFWRSFESKKMQVAQKLGARRYGKYARKTPAEIFHMWDVTRDTGSAKHACSDDFLQGRPAVTHQKGVGEAISEPPAGLYKFLAAHPTLAPYRTEWSLFSKDRKLAGQCDAVFQDVETGELVLADWKHCAVISKEAFPPEPDEAPGDDFGTHPLTKDVPNSNYWHYTMQLNTYRHVLQTCYGVKIARMLLVNFCPERDGEFDEFDVPPWDMRPFFALLPWGKTEVAH